MQVGSQFKSGGAGSVGGVVAGIGRAAEGATKSVDELKAKLDSLAKSAEKNRNLEIYSKEDVDAERGKTKEERQAYYQKQVQAYKELKEASSGAIGRLNAGEALSVNDYEILIKYTAAVSKLRVLSNNLNVGGLAKFIDSSGLKQTAGVLSQLQDSMKNIQKVTGAQNNVVSQSDNVAQETQAYQELNAQVNKYLQLKKESALLDEDSDEWESKAAEMDDILAKIAEKYKLSDSQSDDLGDKLMQDRVGPKKAMSILQKTLGDQFPPQFEEGAKAASAAMDQAAASADKLGAKTQQIDDSIPQQIASYEELCQVVERYNQLVLKGMTKGKTLTDADKSELEAIEQRFAATKGVLDDPDKYLNHAMSMERGRGMLGDYNVDKLAQYLGFEVPAAANKAEAEVKELVAAVKLPNPADFENTWTPSEDQIARVRQLAEEYRIIHSLLQKGGLDSSAFNALLERAKAIEGVMHKIKGADGIASETLKRDYGVSDKTANTFGRVDTYGMKEADNASRQKAIDLIQQEVAAEKELARAKAEAATAEKQGYIDTFAEKYKAATEEAKNSLKEMIALKRTMRDLDDRDDLSDDEKDSKYNEYKEKLHLSRGHLKNTDFDLFDASGDVSLKDMISTLQMTEQELNDVAAAALNVDAQMDKTESGQSFEKIEQGAKEATNAVNGLTQALEKKVKAEQKSDGVVDKPASVKSDLQGEVVNTSAEVGNLEQLRAKLDEVQAAIEAKTAAFTAEGQVVDSVVASEMQNLEQLRAKIEAVKGAIEAKTAAFVAEGQAVPAAVAQEIGILNTLLEKVQSITAAVNINASEFKVGANNIANGVTIPATSQEKKPKDQSIKDDQPSREKTSLSIEQKALGLLQEEWKLRQEMQSLKQKGATDEELRLLQEQIHLRSDLRKTIEEGMTLEEATLYGSRATKIQGSGENKMTVAEVRAEIKERISAEKAAAKEQEIAEKNISMAKEKQAIDYLQKELALRQEINAAQLKGVKDEDLSSLRTKAELYSQFREEIEKAMSAEELARYEDKSIKVQDADENKQRIKELRANAKEQQAIERERLAAQKKADSEAQKLNLVNQKNRLSWLKDSVDFKSTGIDRATTDDSQRKIIEAYDELIGKIGVYSSLNRELTAEEIDGLEKSAAAVREKIDAYNFQADALARAKEFIGNKDAASQSLNDYFNSLNGDFVSEDSLNKLAELESRLNKITNSDDLEKWKADFASATQSISQATNEAEQLALALKNRTLQGIKNAATNHYKSAGIDPENMTEEQLKLSKSYDELIAKIEVYSKRRGQISDEEMADLEAISAKIKEQSNIHAAQAKRNAIQKSGQTKLATLLGAADNAGISSSVAGEAAINKVKKVYEELAAAQMELPKDPTLEQERNVARLEAAYDQATASLKNLISETNNLAKKAIWSNPVDVGGLDKAGKKNAMIEAIKANHDGNIKLGQLSGDGNKMGYSVQNADKSWSHFTATLNQAGTVIASTNGRLKDTDGTLKGMIRGSFEKMKNALQVFTGYDLFFRGIEEIRRGVGYITEIDTALTELKKVTDETDESYAKFLQTMSKTGSAIGANVSNLTNMAADWARLGLDNTLSPLIW